MSEFSADLRNSVRSHLAKKGIMPIVIERTAPKAGHLILDRTDRPARVYGGVNAALDVT